MPKSQASQTTAPAGQMRSAELQAIPASYLNQIVTLNKELLGLMGWTGEQHANQKGLLITEIRSFISADPTIKMPYLVNKFSDLPDDVFKHDPVLSAIKQKLPKFRKINEGEADEELNEAIRVCKITDEKTITELRQTIKTQLQKEIEEALAAYQARKLGDDPSAMKQIYIDHFSAEEKNDLHQLHQQLSRLQTQIQAPSDDLSGQLVAIRRGIEAWKKEMGSKKSENELPELLEKISTVLAAILALPFFIATAISSRVLQGHWSFWKTRHSAESSTKATTQETKSDSKPR